MKDYKNYYGWGTDSYGWFNKQYAKSAMDIREVNGKVEIMVSKADTDGRLSYVWVSACYDNNHSM